MIFTCECGKHLRVHSPEAHKVRCPGCGKVISLSHAHGIQVKAQGGSVRALDPYEPWDPVLARSF